MEYDRLKNNRADARETKRADRATPAEQSEKGARNRGGRKERSHGRDRAHGTGRDRGGGHDTLATTSDGRGVAAG